MRNEVRQGKTTLLKPRDWLWLIAGIIVIGSVAAWFSVNYLERSYRANRNAVLPALQELNSAIKDYQQQNNFRLPHDPRELIDSGVIDRFPQNPFLNRPMHALSPGDLPVVGDFYYLPYYFPDSSTGNVIGYEILGVGKSDGIASGTYVTQTGQRIEGINGDKILAAIHNLPYIAEGTEFVPEVRFDMGTE